MEATDWERNLSHGRLSPTQTERTVAPEIVLKIVSSGCRVACSKRGKSRKARLYRTTICSFCIGQACRNCDSSDDRNAAKAEAVMITITPIL